MHITNFVFCWIRYPCAWVLCDPIHFHLKKNIFLDVVPLDLDFPLYLSIFVILIPGFLHIGWRTWYSAECRSEAADCHRQSPGPGPNNSLTGRSHFGSRQWIRSNRSSRPWKCASTLYFRSTPFLHNDIYIYIYWHSCSNICFVAGYIIFFVLTHWFVSVNLVVHIVIWYHLVLFLGSEG